MVEVFLLIVVCVMAVALLFGMCLTLVVFGHPDDKNVAWVPKVVTVFGLWIAFASVLILPYDVANSSGSGGGVRLDLLWQILYIIVAVLIAVIIPFAFFFYENDLDDESDEAQEGGFLQSQTGMAIKWTLATAVVFCVLLGIMYAFLHNANVPVTRYAQTFDVAVDVKSTTTFDMSACVKGAVVDNRCSVVAYNWVIPVSFPLYVVAFVAFLGWFFFVVFGGVGLAALPVELIQEFTTRPEPMTTKTYFTERASLGARAKSLLEIGARLSAEMEKRHTGSKKRQEGRDMRNLEKHYFYLKKDFQLLTIAYKLRGGNPLEYIAKLIGGIIFAGISLSWFLHIILYMLPAKAITPFLNKFFVVLTDNVPGFPLFGVLVFAIWSFHLLFCVVKGNFRLGVRFLFIKLYPMEIGNTLMNAFLFNTWIIVLCSVPAVQFCVQAFPIYTSGTQASVMFGSQVRYLDFFRYFFLNNVFIIALLVFFCLTCLMLVICPKNQADEVEKTLDRIAKNSNTKTGLKDALEDDD